PGRAVRPAPKADLDVSDPALGDPDGGSVLPRARRERRFRGPSGGAPEPDEDAARPEWAPAAVLAIAERPADLEPCPRRSVERDLREERRLDAFLAGCGKRGDEGHGGGTERGKCETSQGSRVEDTPRRKAASRSLKPGAC